MSLEIFIKCDRIDCESRAQVPTPDAIPHNWIQVRYFKPNLSASTPVAPTVLTLCGWRCLLKHVKGFVRDEVQGD